MKGELKFRWLRSHPVRAGRVICTYENGPHQAGRFDYQEQRISPDGWLLPTGDNRTGFSPGPAQRLQAR
jgi:hypothetical protein